MISELDILGVTGTPLEHAQSAITGPSLNGLEFYGDALARVVAIARKNFAEVHNRVPDPVGLPLAADHLFFSKFLRRFPHPPNPASKIDGARYLDHARFGDRVHVPRKLFVTDRPAFPADRSGLIGAWLKLDLGNGAHRRMTPELAAADDRQVKQAMSAALTHQYGLGWGEWWYSASPQRIFFEEDLTNRMTGFEYQVHINRQVCHLIRKRRVTQSPVARAVLKEDCFFDDRLNHIPGSARNHSALADKSISPFVDLMREAALQIGQHFDHVRVDFIELQDRPALGELTLCTMNARVWYSTKPLEEAVKAAVALV